MVQGELVKDIVKKDVNYRALTALNYSMIKLFDSDPVKFYEQFKLGKARKDNTSTSLLIGDIVDFYLLECGGDDEVFNNRFEDRFALYSGHKGSGQAYILADTLFQITQECTNDRGEITVSFESRFKEAFQKVQAMDKYKGRTEEWALADFNDKAYDYFQSLMDNVGKIVVETSLLDKAVSIAKQLREDQFTRDVFSEDSDDETLLTKFPIEWKFNSGGTSIPCKSEIDIMKIVHSEKKIYLRDLKTTYDNENFEYSYIKHSYYIQAAFYYMAVDEWKDSEGMSDYTIEPMEFIVADTSSNNRRPLRYKTSLHDLNMALKGFSLRGNDYRGVLPLVREITWAEQNDIWNASKNVIDNNGQLKLELKYD